mgnify:CR=1 FL=1
MENTSYIKLFRKLLNSPIFENEKALKIWIWCLLKATHKKREQLVGQQIVNLEKGEFVFGRKQASEEAGKQFEFNAKIREQNMKKEIEDKKVALEKEKLASQERLQKQKDKAALEREKLKARTALKNKVAGEK